MQIEVKEEAAVAGKFVRFADIADVSGDDPIRIEGIRRIFCGLAPREKRQRLVSLFYLRARLTQSGLHGGDVTWSGARAVWVRGGETANVVVKANANVPSPAKTYTKPQEVVVAVKPADALAENDLPASIAERRAIGEIEPDDAVRSFYVVAAWTDAMQELFEAIVEDSRAAEQPRMMALETLEELAEQAASGELSHDKARAIIFADRPVGGDVGGGGGDVGGGGG